MKKIFAFGKKRKGFSPSSSDTGSVLSLGYEIKEKDLGKVHKAASSGDLAKLKQLAKKNDLNQLDKENRTPLHIACANGHAEVVQFLVERKVKLNLCDNQNRSPLMKAVQCQQERCASTLLEHNANPNLVDINGNTALHLAASIPLATQLLEHEANINALNNDGCTPLTLAVTENHVEIAEFLLKEGADVNTRDQAQRTPLMIAACNGQTSLISLLLRYDADITVKDEKGWTADDYAVINGYHACSHLIIQHGTKRKSQHSPLYLGAGKNKGLLGSPAQGDNVGFSLGRPATNREVDEDNSQAESISRESKCGAGDSWLSSDEDDGLQSIPKKPQKVNLKKLLSASENGRKNERPDFDKSWNESESERESENEAKGNPALPLTIPHSGISQHPASPSPASFSNPPQMTSTPLMGGKKTALGSGHSEKASTSMQEVFNSDDEVGEEIEESDEAEDEREEEEEEDDDDDDENEEECEDEEEEDEEEEDEEKEEGSEDEETDEEEEDCVAKSVIVTEVVEKEDTPNNTDTKDIQTFIGVAASGSKKIPVEISTLGLHQDGTVADVQSIERKNVFEDNNNDRVTENQVIDVNHGIPTALDFGDDFVVSAIRVQSRFSDEEESSNDELASPVDTFVIPPCIEPVLKSNYLEKCRIPGNDLDIDDKDEDDQSKFAEKSWDDEKCSGEDDDGDDGLLEANVLTKAEIFCENLKIPANESCDNGKNKEIQVDGVNDDNSETRFETETKTSEKFTRLKSVSDSWDDKSGSDKGDDDDDGGFHAEPKAVLQQIVRPESLGESWDQKKKIHNAFFLICPNDDNDSETDFKEESKISCQQSPLPKILYDSGKDEHMESYTFDSDFLVGASSQNFQSETLLHKAELTSSNDYCTVDDDDNEIETGFLKEQETQAQHNPSKLGKGFKADYDDSVSETMVPEESVTFSGRIKDENLLGRKADESLNNKNEDEGMSDALVAVKSTVDTLENEKQGNVSACRTELGKLMNETMSLEAPLEDKNEAEINSYLGNVLKVQFSTRPFAPDQLESSFLEDSLKNKTVADKFDYEWTPTLKEPKLLSQEKTSDGLNRPTYFSSSSNMNKVQSFGDIAEQSKSDLPVSLIVGRYDGPCDIREHSKQETKEYESDESANKSEDSDSEIQQMEYDFVSGIVGAPKEKDGSDESRNFSEEGDQISDSPHHLRTNPLNAGRGSCPENNQRVTEASLEYFDEESERMSQSCGGYQENDQHDNSARASHKEEYCEERRCYNDGDLRNGNSDDLEENDTVEQSIGGDRAEHSIPKTFLHAVSPYEELESSSVCCEEQRGEEVVPRTAIDDVKLYPYPVEPQYIMEGKEQDYTEDEYDDDEEDEECSDRKGSNEEDDGETEVVQHGSNKKHGHIAADIKMHKSKGASKDVKRDFLSELGLEASADEEDSPWDSSSSDSPSKQNVDVVKAPAKGKHGTSTSEDKNEDLFYVPSFLRGPRNDRMPKVESLRSVGRPGDLKGQASREDTTDGLGGKFEELPTQPASAFPPASKDSSNATKKIDLMEELGLGDIDDLEECQKKDSSDWDTSSSASENIVGPKEVLSQVLGPPALKETNPDCLVPASPADREEDLPSSILEGEQTRNPRRSQTPSQSPPLPSPRTLTPGSTKQLQNQPQPQPRFRKHHVAQDEGIPPPDTVPEDGESDASAKPEEPQEGKNVMGKIELGVSKPCHTGPMESQNEGFHLEENDGEESDEDEEQLSWEKRYEKIWVEAEKREVKSQYRSVTAELKERFGELGFKETGITAQDASSKMEDPPTHTVEEEFSEEEEFVKPSASIPLVPIIEQRESGLEDSLSEPKEVLPSAVDTKPQLSGNTLSEKKTSEHSRNNMKDRELGGTRHKTKHGEQDSEHAMESHKGGSLGWLSCSVITVDDDRAYLGPDGRGDGKGPIGNVGSHLFSDGGAESSRAPCLPIGQPSASLRLSDEQLKEDVQRFKHEVGMLKLVFLDLQNEKTQLRREVGGEKKLLSDAGNQCLLQNPKEPSRKSDTDTDKLTKGEAGQRDLKSDSTCKKETTSTQNEQKIEVTDGVKERYVAQNPKRFSATENPKSKVTEEIKIADEFDDLTESSDTATEDMDSLASGYRNASLLIKQLDTSSIDSVSMVKLQNMFLEYERTVQREKGRSSRLAEKISQLEGEQAELKRSLEETRNAKSSLEHQHMELESDFSNLKFVLKQEQEKHRNATALYDKSREQLRVKEEQYLSEAEERQKLELTMRNLELEMRALMNSMKQLEEDNNESQRLLAHERHARALQEGILNSHLHKQKELEAENKRNLNKSNELLEANDREKDLLQQNRSLQEEVTTLRLELEQARAHSRQEEIHLSEESDALKERLEDAKRDLKLNEEALAQTVYRYNGELSTLRAECSVVTAKLEHERQTREKLETEVESARARLTAALQEVERCQDARADAERALQRERDERQRTLEKHMTEMTGQRESIQSLSQQLGTAEARANGLENELHRATLTLTERSLLVETAQRERSQAQARLAELEAALQAEREVAERAVARQEATQERLAQTQSETMLLRQQLEDAQNRGVIKERAVTDAQERFSELLSKLRADCEERVRMAEDWSKEQVAKNGELQEQLLRQEQEKTERETTLRQLQQELADTLKKLSMCEASLEVNSRHRSDLEEEKLRMQKDVDRFKGRLQESEEQHFQTERRLHELQSILKDKEREVITASQKLQEVLSASEGAEKTIRQLEEAMQRLEIENARLDAVAKQQTNRIDFLQKGAQEASVVRNRLEDLVTDLQGNKIHLEDQLHREVKKQSELSHNVQDSHQLWEEELKTRSRLALRLAELEREKAELSSQMDIEKKKAKKIAEQKRSMDIRLDQEMKRNTELQKEMYRLKTLVKTAKKKLKEQDNAELSSPLGGLRGELSHRQLEAESTVTRMKSRVDELSLQLEREERKCSRLEAVNIELKEQLSSLKALNRSNERLEKSKKELEEEVSNLRRQMDAGMMDQKQAEQYRRETEERARQEIRQKLEEVNLFLQTQAASQEALEQMKAASEASLRAQLEQRIQDLESELNRLRSTQQDNASQKDSAQVQLERYRELYAEELKLRKSLAAKLERSNERLAEANTRLLHERQRSKSLIASSIVNGSLGGPSLDVGPLGSVGAYGGSLGPLNRSLGLGLGGSLLSPMANEPNSKVEAYLAKMQNELEKNISKELDKATVELEGRAARMSPVGSAGGSQWGLSADQDPVARATQQYLEVLKKNYKI